MNTPRRSCSLMVLLGVGVCGVGGGCAAPGTVQGVFAGEDFVLHSDAPLFKPTGSGRDMVIVLAQSDDETLSTIGIVVPAFASLAPGAPVTVGAGAYGDPRPSLKVAVGALLVETRADGAELISSTDAIGAATVGGTFTLEGVSETEIAGSFTVDLDDGGYLEGAFVATPGS